MSDERLKKDIQPLDYDEAVKIIQLIEPKTFSMRDEKPEHILKWVVAQAEEIQALKAENNAIKQVLWKYNQVPKYVVKNKKDILIVLRRNNTKMPKTTFVYPVF